MTDAEKQDGQRQRDGAAMSHGGRMRMTEKRNGHEATGERT